ncbi:MAG: hypothetical protein KAR54_00735 [Candidatus Pacebacteria bacterium]|nr:hypothetical protein [Candidatus Paceibacterota bacterium]
MLVALNNSLGNLEKPIYSNLKETILQEPYGSFTSIKIEVKEKISWIDPKLLFGLPTRFAAECMKEKNGKGPFVLKRITKYPNGNVILTFYNKNGEIKNINSIYFTKYNTRKSFRSVIHTERKQS